MRARHPQRRWATTRRSVQALFASKSPSWRRSHSKTSRNQRAFWLSCASASTTVVARRRVNLSAWTRVSPALSSNRKTRSRWSSCSAMQALLMRQTRARPGWPCVSSAYRFCTIWARLTATENSLSTIVIKILCKCWQRTFTRLNNGATKKPQKEFKISNLTSSFGVIYIFHSLFSTIWWPMKMMFKWNIILLKTCPNARCTWRKNSSSSKMDTFKA